MVLGLNSHVLLTCVADKFYSGRETPMEPWLMLCYTDNCMCANSKRTLQSYRVFGNMFMDFTYSKELTNKGNAITHSQSLPYNATQIFPVHSTCSHFFWNVKVICNSMFLGVVLVFRGGAVLVSSLPSVLVQREASEVRRGRPTVALDILQVCVCVCVYTYVFVCVCACLCACVCVYCNVLHICSPFCNFSTPRVCPFNVL